MKKTAGKKHKMGALTVIGVLLLILLWYGLFLLTGFGPVPPLLKASSVEEHRLPNVEAGRELMALVDTAEEAEAVAHEYNIVLVSFGDGVAVYTTDRDPDKIVEESKRSGAAELYLNNVMYIDIDE